MAKPNIVRLDQARLRDGMRVYAVGDVHGCIDELDALLELIEFDLKHSPIPDHRLIFIGDYVDRGPDSKAVIDRLIGLQKAGKPVTCLLGNHEEKLIAAYTDMDEQLLPGFTKYGGLETLTSYGCLSDDVRQVLGGKTDEASFIAFRDGVRTGIGEDHIRFLNGLELSTQEGDYFFCHAGIDPEIPLSEQSNRDLVWMREPFLSWPLALEKVVVHGHTPTNEIEFLPHRINTDTGCIFGGKLSCVVLEQDQKRLLSVPANRYYYQKEGF